MNIKEIHNHMIYDEFGKKDYEGYILLTLMFCYTIFMILGTIGWLIFLLGLKNEIL